MTIEAPITGAKIVAEIGRSGPMSMSDADVLGLVNKQGGPISASDFDGASSTIYQLNPQSFTDSGVGGGTSVGVTLVFNSSGSFVVSRIKNSTINMPPWVVPGGAGVGANHDIRFTQQAQSGGGSYGGSGFGSWLNMGNQRTASFTAAGAFIEATGAILVEIRTVSPLQLVAAATYSFTLNREP